jgi:Zn-dependent peptidase ImmA (M78 family)
MYDERSVDDFSHFLHRPRWQPPYEGEGYERTFLKSGVVKWVEENRVPPDGPLNMEATAAVLGAEVDLDYGTDHLEKGRTTGTWDDLVVHARSDLSPGERRITIAHELGHVYLSKVLFAGDYSTHAEVFSEYFGHELAMPARKFEKLASVNESTVIALARQYGLSEEAVITQLTFAGKLPRKLIIRKETINEETGQYETVDNVHCFACNVYSHEACENIPKEQLRILDFWRVEVDISPGICVQEIPNYLNRHQTYD